MGTSAFVTAAVSTAIAGGALRAAASAGSCMNTRHPISSSAAAAMSPSQPRLPNLRKSFIDASPLMPSAAKRGEQVHQRLKTQIIHLYQFILCAEQRIFRVEHGQNVHDARG